VGPVTRTAPVWIYHFDHLMSFGPQVWGPNYTICYTHVCHGSELPFVFHPNASAFNLSYTPQEEVLSASMVAAWTNMAKYLDPNGPSGEGVPSKSGASLYWPAFTLDNQSSIVFDTPNSIVHNNFTDECNWWDAIGYDYS
jgi:carboxylesterase type B